MTVPSARLTMTVTSRAGRATIVARGEIDIATAPDLEERASLLLRRPIDRLTLDLRDVTVVDSTGLAALVRISQRAHAVDCVIALTNVRPLVRRVMDVTGMAGVLNVQDRG
jgi:anti-sigma B factor antagonist